MASVLFMMPEWNIPSELFMRRQIRMLAEADALESIVTSDASGVGRRYEGVPIIPLTDNALARRVMGGVGRRLGFNWYKAKSPSEILETLLRKSRADAILCQYGTYAVGFLPILKRGSQRVFVHVHGYDTHQQLCPRGYREALVELSDFSIIICNSNETRRRLMEWGVQLEKICMKYCGVEVPTTPTIRNNSSTVTILHLGRLVDCKSPDRTIKAFELACERGLQGELIVAGDGPLKITCELLKARSRWRERIRILGSVGAEVGAKLREQANIFTMHSIEGELTGQVEAFGVAIVEAMAASLPVVSCRIGGVMETVVDGETGVLVNPGDVEAQAEALLRLALEPDLRQKMGEAGYRRAKEHFSWEKERAELLRILGLP